MGGTRKRLQVAVALATVGLQLLQLAYLLHRVRRTALGRRLSPGDLRPAPALLLALLRQGSDAYGVSISDDIAARTGRSVSLGAVYKTLDRLEDKGLVASHIGQPTPERGGRRKKHYRLLGAGQRALKSSVAALGRMTEGLEGQLR